MIELHLPFIPPTSNHTQKNAEFKQRVVAELWKKNPEENLWAYTDVEAEEFKVFLSSPHKVTINIYSPRVLTKKVDNFIKPLLDAVYKPLGANDALVMQVTASKFQADIEATSIIWEPLV